MLLYHTDDIMMQMANIRLLSTVLANCASLKGNDGLPYYERGICHGTVLIKAYIEISRRRFAEKGASWIDGAG